VGGVSSRTLRGVWHRRDAQRGSAGPRPIKRPFWRGFQEVVGAVRAPCVALVAEARNGLARALAIRSSTARLTGFAPPGPHGVGPRICSKYANVLSI